MVPSLQQSNQLYSTYLGVTATVSYSLPSLRVSSTDHFLPLPHWPNSLIDRATCVTRKRIMEVPNEEVSILLVKSHESTSHYYVLHLVHRVPKLLQLQTKKGNSGGGVGRNTHHCLAVDTLIVAPVQCGAWLGGMGCSVPWWLALTLATEKMRTVSEHSNVVCNCMRKLKMQQDPILHQENPGMARVCLYRHTTVYSIYVPQMDR